MKTDKIEKLEVISNCGLRNNSDQFSTFSKKEALWRLSCPTVGVAHVHAFSPTLIGRSMASDGGFELTTSGTAKKRVYFLSKAPE